MNDSTDGQTYDLEVDLNDIQVNFPENHEKKIMITDEIGMVMKYPTPAISEKLKTAKSITDITSTTIQECIEYVFDEEDTYPWSQSTPKEREEFLDQLPIDAYNKIQNFFETSPSIEHIVTYINSENTEKKVVFRDLNDFFMLD